MDNKLKIIFEKAIMKKEKKENVNFNLNLNKEKDALEKYLNYWILQKEKIISLEIDKMWLKDASFINYRNEKERIYADTIFSVWTPLKRCIEIITGNIYNKKLENLEYIKKEKDIIFKNHQELYKAVNKFAESACKKGNVIEYPAYPKDNGARSGLFQTRGNPKLYNDIFLISLYNCFPEGYFFKLFNEKSNYKNINDWIKKQKLEIFFKDKKNFNKNNIIEIASQTSKNNNWNNVNEEQMIKILNEYSRIIEERTIELDKK